MAGPKLLPQNSIIITIPMKGLKVDKAPRTKGNKNIYSITYAISAI